jgi:hypothetical protein
VALDKRERQFPPKLSATLDFIGRLGQALGSGARALPEARRNARASSPISAIATSWSCATTAC